MEGLKEKIKTRLNEGKSKEEIYLELLNDGIKVDDVQIAFAKITVIPQKTEEEEKDETHKKTIRVVLAIGAVLIGAGIFSFIAANWQELSKPSRIAIILVAMLASYFLGFWLREKKNYPKTGNALIFLGAIIYGSGIFLVGQMFNIRTNWPDGFILWMLGILPLAFIFRLNGLYYLSIVLSLIALIGHPINIVFSLLGGDRFLLTSSLVLIAATLATFYTGFVIRKKELDTK